MTRVAVQFHELAAAAGFKLLDERPVPWLSPKGHFNPVVQSGVPAQLLKALDTILDALGGDARKLAAKSRGQVRADFVWPARNQIIEVDEIQHFTRHPAATFSCYPAGARLAFVPAAYVRLCNQFYERAEKAYSHVLVPEFPGAQSRARQRAYNDVLRDLCAPYFTAGAVLRIPAPERDANLVLRRFKDLASRPSASSPFVVDLGDGRRIVKNYANPVTVRRRPPA